MIEFRDALTDLTDEFGTDDGGFEGELPEGQHFRVENKNFYFDIGQNNRGVYMRISEVKTNFRCELKCCKISQFMTLFFDSRNAITIPEKSWGKFRDVFDDYVEKMKEANAEVENQKAGEKEEEAAEK